MNLAVGLTPAWQQILAFDRFRLGEVNRAAEAHWCASGKVLNVGIALHRLGGPSRTLAMIGGAPRVGIEEEFAALGVPRRWVVSAAKTRVCTTILDRSSGELVMTELVENASPMGTREYEAFLAAYEEEARKASTVVLTGSLPAGTPKRFYRDLLERSSAPAVLDVRGEELLEALELQPLVVKPNREELGRTFGRGLRSDVDLRAAMRELQERGADWVVISQGKDRVLVGGPEGREWTLVPPPVEAVNPIGCGDCLAAGIAWGVSRGRDVIDAVRLGMAAAAQNLADLLPSRLDPRSVERIAGGISAEETRG